MDRAAEFFGRGWVRFPHDPQIADWAARARPVADACLANPEHRARWLRCGGTWFIGVNLLPNDAAGAVPNADVPPLRGAPVEFIANALELPVMLDPGQVSVCFPGYPQPSPDEPESTFRFRRDHDAAHVDGLKRFDGRRRRPGDRHGFILGVPLSKAPADAAPLVVWEGSHEVMRRALRVRLENVPPERWADEDVTEVYQAARRECFETCRRVAVHAEPGEAYLIHRLALHGIAPWTAPRAGERTIVYFRPNPFPDAPPGWWLERP
ncbi:MAG TPA: hypothetical protein VFV10_17710 [Gammaproteobacteria bacterium]|nr:hypothetical protein [Gammaproteobacteria bacterium]